MTQVLTCTHDRIRERGERGLLAFSSHGSHFVLSPTHAFHGLGGGRWGNGRRCRRSSITSTDRYQFSGGCNRVGQQCSRGGGGGCNWQRRGFACRAKCTPNRHST